MKANGITPPPKPPSISSFFEMWEKDFFKYKVCKVNPSAQCDVCCFLRDKMHLALSHHKAYYRRLLPEHQEAVRQMYWNIRSVVNDNVCSGCIHLVMTGWA